MNEERGNVEDKKPSKPQQQKNNSKTEPHISPLSFYAGKVLSKDGWGRCSKSPSATEPLVARGGRTVAFGLVAVAKEIRGVADVGIRDRHADVP